VVLSLVIIFMGRQVNSVRVMPLPDSPAIKSGLETGDEVLSIDGNKIVSTRQMIKVVGANKGEPMQFVIRRQEEEFNFEVVPKFNTEHQRAMIGVSLQELFVEFSREDMSIMDYLSGGLVWTYDMTAMMLKMIWMLITRQVSTANLMGPVGLIRVTAAIAKTGFLNLITLFAMINMNLAIINLLPIPAVDGGHVAMLLCEKIARRRIPDKAKNIINYTGIVFLLTLMLWITGGDILKWKRGEYKKIDEMLEKANTQKKENSAEPFPGDPVEKNTKDVE